MSGRRRRRHALAAIVTGWVVILAGCASMPTETTPQGIVAGDTQDRTDLVGTGPEDDFSPEKVLREFIAANANPAEDYGTSRLYLSSELQDAWRPGRRVAVLASQPLPDISRTGDQEDDADEVTLRVEGRYVGFLEPDGSFLPHDREYDAEFRLSREGADGGQWRIAEPPDELVTIQREVDDKYQRIRLYFPARDNDAVMVPDYRLVPEKPQASIPIRVVDWLIGGPSDALAGAVNNPLGGIELAGNVTVSDDGAVDVSLANVNTEDPDEPARMIDQIVRSMDRFADRVRVQSGGEPLVAALTTARRADLGSYTALVSPSSEHAGMAVVDGALVSLRDGQPIPGPAGDGRYDVISAGQSLEGGRLAVVERVDDDGQRLRVGEVSSGLAVVELDAETLTRPTWRPALPDTEHSNEVWTVQDGEHVVRVLLSQDGSWKPQRVDTSDLEREKIGEITALRLSRDGTRAAMVADGYLVMAAVTRQEDSVRLRRPVTLGAPQVFDAIDVDWLSQDTVVIGRADGARPVMQVEVDGFADAAYERENMRPPVVSVAAAPGRGVVAANARGLWTASGTTDQWRPHDQIGANGAVPFYPG